MPAATLELERLVVRLVCDASDYLKPLENVVAQTNAAAQQIERVLSNMVANVESQLGRVPVAVERNVVQSLQKAGVNSVQAANAISSNMATASVAAQQLTGSITAASAATNNAGNTLSLASGGMLRIGQSAAQAAQAAAQVGPTLTTVTQTASAATAASGRLSVSMRTLGTGMRRLAAFAGMLSPELGLGIFGLTGMGAATVPVTAALATFGAAVVGTTYLLRGSEAAINAPKDSLELLKIGLAKATFGWLDYTEATKMAAESQAAFDRFAASSASVAGQMIAERTDRITGLAAEIAALRDVSQSAEAAFIGQLRSYLSARGVLGENLDAVAGQAADAFRQRRIGDVISSLEREAETYRMSREELALYKLAQDNASESDIARARAAIEKMAAIDAAKDAEREAARAADEAARAAKAAADAAQRERDKIMAEGQRVADSLRTAEEKAADDLLHLQELFDQGAISAETLARGVAKINDELKPKDVQHSVRIKTHSDRPLTAVLGGTLAAEQLLAQRAERGAIRSSASATTPATSVAGVVGKSLSPALAAPIAAARAAEERNRRIARLYGYDPDSLTASRTAQPVASTPILPTPIANRAGATPPTPQGGNMRDVVSLLERQVEATERIGDALDGKTTLQLAAANLS